MSVVILKFIIIAYLTGMSLTGILTFHTMTERRESIDQRLKDEGVESGSAFSIYWLIAYAVIMLAWPVWFFKSDEEI